MLSVEKIRELIRTGRVEEFYHENSWERLSKKIRKEQPECWFCKHRGRVGPPDLVHHRYELKKFPECAYSRYYVDALGVKHINLVSCCKPCHEEQHAREGVQPRREHFTNAERW